jgi:hypothetical protein
MGVERQTAKVNWLTSLAMIVTAGTFYRSRKLLKEISATQISDLLVRYGLMNETKHSMNIIGKPVKKQVG